MIPVRIGRPLAVVAVALLATGCALQAPRYQPSLDNLEVVKKFPSPLMLGTFSVQPGAGAASIGLRGGSMVSPVGADYAAYLGDALRQELLLAGKLDAQSKIEVSGMLLKNDIAAGGIVTNSGEIEARIVVRNAGVQRYDKVKRAEATWESSFAGAVAVPKAQQQYPLIVQQLLSRIWTDADFQAAIK